VGGEDLQINAKGGLVQPLCRAGLDQVLGLQIEVELLTPMKHGVLAGLIVAVEFRWLGDEKERLGREGSSHADLFQRGLEGLDGTLIITLRERILGLVEERSDVHRRGGVNI
ncbi:MAG TPA: hypothetical protein VGC99_24130, partial [Candidatus Tectomicrobia bacterium]